MARTAEKITVSYRDETGNLKSLEVPIADNITVGQVVDRCTNGAVSQGSHVITKNGTPCPPTTPCADGDNVVASPRKTAGGDARPRVAA